MERKVVLTEDGSHTLHIPEMDEHYHSTHGAIQESKHVFIEAGLKAITKAEINILEVGLGTGLNTLLTYNENRNSTRRINYFGIEKFPLNELEFRSLNYAEQIAKDLDPVFLQIHQSQWQQAINLSPNFLLTKLNADIKSINWDTLPLFDLIYFDAFAPNKQEGIWNTEIFQKIYDKCNSEAIFVTYCAQGQVRRDLKSVGFKVERLQGPPGKREMLRAIK